MKCFIHRQREAIATCKNCGKAMCENCSAYSNHSGICPECRREEFIARSNYIGRQIEELKTEKTQKFVLSIIFCWLIVPLLLGLYGNSVRKKRIVELTNEKTRLDAEIAKLNKAMQAGIPNI